MADCDHPTGEKCAECVASSAIYMATSFAELDAAREAVDEARSIEGVMSDFRIIMNAILADPEKTPAQKTTAMRSLVDDLGDRLENPPERKEMDEGEHKGLLDRAKDVLGLGEKASKVEGGVTYQASDYADVPDASTPSTWKLRLAEGRSGNITVAQVARAITALQPGGFRGNRVELGSRKASVISKISGAISRASGDAAQKRNLRERLNRVKELEPLPGEGGAFRAFKAADGSWSWVAIYSNNLYDREGEVIPEAEHRAFIDRATKEGPMPELWLWHTPGSRCGQTKTLDLSGGFAIAGGVFDTGAEAVAAALAEDDNLGVSHGFSYREKTADGQILGYRTFEISPLPADRAANIYTGFLVGEKDMEDAMALDPSKRPWFVEKLGEEGTKLLEARLDAEGDKALKDGVTFKAFIEGIPGLGQKDDAEGAGTASQDAQGGQDGEGGAQAVSTVKIDTESLTEALAPVLEGMRQLAAAQAEQAKAINALQGGSDSAPSGEGKEPEKKKSIADLVGEAMRPKGASVFIASESEATQIHGNSGDAKALKSGTLDVPKGLEPQAELLASVLGRGNAAGALFDASKRVIGPSEEGVDQNDDGGAS